MSKHYVSLEMETATACGSSVVTVMAGYDRMTGSWRLEVNNPALPENEFGGNVYDSSIDSRLYQGGRGTVEAPFAGLGFGELQVRLTELCLVLPKEMLKAVEQDGLNQVAPDVKRWAV